MRSMGLRSLSSLCPAASFAKRACLAFARARIASSTAGQYSAWAGVNCRAALTTSILRSVKAFNSAWRDKS